MELFRWGQHHHHAKTESDLCTVYADDHEAKKIQVIFEKFGRGRYRTSELGFQLNWDDMQTLIRLFAQMGHPDAIRLQNASKLATAVESAGWSSDAPQLN
jgi:hypothetical protein